MTHGGDAGVRRFDEGTAASQHVAHTRKGHKTGGKHQEVPVLHGIQVSQERQQVSRQAGYCASKILCGDFRPRLLLHRHPGCRYATTPSTNREFWQKKFDQNVARDKKVQEQLKADGWNVIVVWECELSRKADCEERLQRLEREIRE